MQADYKQYKRNRRTQLIEENFKYGMQYSSAPLAQGYLKELVNYDIKDNGEAIVPRPGVQSTSLINITDTSSSLLLVAKNKVEDNVEYLRFFTGNVTTEVITGTNLKTGTLSVLTKTPTTTTTSSLSGAQKGLFIIPNKAEIHKIDLVETTPIARVVGAFAFNNEFYTFGYSSGYTLQKTVKGATGYNFSTITPKAPTPKEAVMWGYNMLLTNPYTFACSNTASGVNLLGMMPYDASGNLLMSPLVNQSVTLKCFYATAKTIYKVLWEYKDITATTWIKLPVQTVDTTSNTPFALDISFPTEQVMVKISVYASTETNLDTAVPLQVQTVGFNLSKEDYGTTANVKPQTYTLGTATGMAYWKNRLVLYGVKEDPTQLFMSEVNDPSYFPYPNNVDLFEEPIIHVVPYLDNLLVFTTRQLWMLTLSQDGLSWNKKLIQSNLTINNWDLHLIKIVKNMVFFRSGNYYYMVVPKASSTTGELVIAPISKQIEGLLNNFEPTVKSTIKKLYNYDDTLELIHYYNFLDYEDIHNVYVFRTSKGVYLNYVLLYNSLTRYWRSYIFESTSFIIPYVQDATKKGNLMSTHKLGISIYQFIDNDPCDKYYSDDGTLQETKFFKNYQMINTGFRDHASDFKKRYRELQFKINNTSQQQLNFYTEFGIDGYIRKDTYQYSAIHHTDTTDSLYGYITLERTLVDPYTIPSTTILADTTDDTSYWLLDSSLFPEVMFWKIRIPVSGKGYAPALILISKNQYSYELLNMSWIFRQLNSR